MYILHYRLVTVILLVQIISSFQKDIPLHYPNRVNRCYEDDDNSCSTLNILAQIISLLIFVFYILIIFGLIKACLGLCCSSTVGEMGLDLVMDHPVCQCNRNTIFCLNVVFFLVLPFALLRNLCMPRHCEQQTRMCGGSEGKPNKTQTNLTEQPKLSTEKITKKKKGGMAVYRDETDSETQDTKFVLEQLHGSEQSLRNGGYGYASISEQ